ncbi:hypothetical protein [Bacillus wiedmannii]|uniref:hypothetical protein n=1 Tax=Bacillus wiedmannii TaxID=1890302 RepID=UPI000BF1CFC1|nr:hypothetical protein [Bacillus wiedmannii]PEO38317.1 hypothetical protein CN555_14005 [Bacillus wiedmannii]
MTAQIVTFKDNKYVVKDNGNGEPKLTRLQEEYGWGDVFTDGRETVYISQYVYGKGNYFNMSSGNRYNEDHEGSKEEVVSRLIGLGYHKVGNLRQLRDSFEASKAASF